MRLIKPGRVDGICRAPSSKSELQRVIAAASLARGQSEISFYSLCDDSKSALGIVAALGASVLAQEERVIIRGGLKPAGLLDCGESGLCLRMFAPIAALFDREITLAGRGTLLKRPVSMVERALENAGARCHSRGGHPPLTVRGPLSGGRINVDGSVSSQHVTGLLLALPLIETDSELVVENARSLPYLKLTLAVMEAFGVRTEADFAAGRYFVPGGLAYRPRRYRVEGDWSAAAFLLVAGAVAGRVTVEGVTHESPQADRSIVRVLASCGATVSSSPDGVTASRGSLSAFDFDAADSPDLVPPLSVLACFCRGTSRIRGISRLRHKESDRVEALLDVLGRMQGKLRATGDCLEITGSRLRGASVSSHHDHRIAMAAAVAGLGSRDGAEISDPGCVAKSYPRFFDDLERLKGRKDTP
jgi:3-phosphoshikimate 1-carboxyvinyltransferase